MFKQFISFIVKETLHIWRDKRTLFILFGMPIAQIVLFGFALTNEVKNAKVVVFDPSNDAGTIALITKLDASKYFEIEKITRSRSEVEDIFKKGEIKLVVLFPERFSENLLHTNNAQVQFIADATDPNTATTLVNYATAIVTDYQTEIMNGNKIPYSIQTQTRMFYNPQLQGAYNFVPGVMAMILLLVCTMMTSISIVREKELGTMEILLTSPLQPALVIVAKAVPYFFLSVINVTSILLLSVFALDLPIRGSIILLMLESMLFIFTSLALGLLISNITKSQQVAMMISLVGMLLPTLMLSGFMFPIENMPLVLQLISNIVPAKWFFIIVKDVMLKGLGISSVIKETSILAGMTVILLFISIKKFNIRLQ